MLIPFGGILESKTGSKNIFIVFVAAMVASSMVFHLLAYNQDIQACGIFAIGYAFVTGGMMNLSDVWKKFSL